LAGNRSLVEVGKLEIPKIQGKYDAGQLFLHRVFGYRGVILFPWVNIVSKLNFDIIISLNTLNVYFNPVS
jgi:hypothetical protein